MSVQFEFAKDESGEIVYVMNAERGQQFTCTNKNCDGEMILKKGQIRVPHFAHKHIEFNHAGESVLHYNIKNLVYNFLQKAISKKEPVFALFECPCSETHYIDLVEDIESIYMERQVSEIYRPDIALYCGTQFKLAIEIVVTHELEHEALSYLVKNNVPYLVITATSVLYSELLTSYLSESHTLLNLTDDVRLSGISLSDYCENNVLVTYYPDLKNIFPCFGYENTNPDMDSDDEFHGKIDNGLVPCDTCVHLHSKCTNNTLLCKNPLAKQNVFSKWDKYITPTIFKLDKYYKSGKRHREDGTYIEIDKQIKIHRSSMEFFEYETCQYIFSDEFYGRYMKVYKNGEWVELNELEMMMKDTCFYFGKHQEESIDTVYQTDKQYLYWVLKTKPHGYHTDDIIKVLNAMKRNGYL